ncbi:MAG TPA: hypothetical protein VGK58_20820 [Lacipirellulaceae bacterium]
MRQYLCEVCGQAATIHETAVNDGTVNYRHLCQVHGQEILLVPVVKQDDAAFQAMVDSYRSLSDAEKDELALDYRLRRRAALP